MLTTAFNILNKKRKQFFFLCYTYSSKITEISSNMFYTKNKCRFERKELHSFILNMRGIS